MPDHYEQQVEREVKQFLRDNPELAKAHLPEKEGFEQPAPKWPVPQSLLDMFGDKKAPITGTGSEDLHKALHDRHEKLRELIGDKDDAIIRNYSQYGYESINPFLRKKGYKQWEKMNQMLVNRWNGGEPFNYVEDVVKPRIASLDESLAKSPKLDEPEKLYRFYEVPPGVTPEEYAKKYFVPGTGFQDKGFVSTSADPEFIAANVLISSDKKRNTRYVVLEILSKNGTSMQNRPYSSPGNVQTLEAEVLLPRNQKMRIIDQGKRTITMSRDRKDLTGYANRYDKPNLEFTEGMKISVPVVRMIDEDLIREERKKTEG